MGTKKTHRFKAEVRQLLDLVIHSLYSKKEIFLRELISNASDAIDRCAFEALTDKGLLDDNPHGKIKLRIDKTARTITVSDNGIGMSADEVERNIGTIANSGTRTFLESLKQSNTAADAAFIGQFGVGFYASFMVADTVTIITRRAGAEGAVKWVSEGDGNYTMEDAEREGRGTDVTLHLREGMDEYLEEWAIRRIVKHYSDYIAYPVVMDVTCEDKPKKKGDQPVTRVEEQTLNSMKAIWKKDRKEIDEEAYNEFYKHISHDYTDPLTTIHYAAEGQTEFRALLYIPSQAPFDLFLREGHRGVHLYVKNVFITEDCRELLPEYLRFVRGVVDSSDLPLNVSREMLQDDAVIKRIRKNLVGRILKTLADLKEKDADRYQTFYNAFGKVLKEGLHGDRENTDKLRDLVMFESSATTPGERITLKEYVARMPPEQSEIYFMAGESRDAVAHSPHLEALRQRNYEVLFFLDPIDEWILTGLSEYDGKSLKSIDCGDLKLGTEEEKKKAETEQETARKELQDLLAFVRETLKDEVKDVRVSLRLTDSPCCLVADEGGMNAHMERLMRAMNQNVPHDARILEINPKHPVLQRMKALFDQDREAPLLKDFVDLLHGQALLTEGSPLKDPVRFTGLVNRLMVSAS